jgi:tetratricopeptide (TPR) repeat protein
MKESSWASLDKRMLNAISNGHNAVEMLVSCSVDELEALAEIFLPDITMKLFVAAVGLSIRAGRVDNASKILGVADRILAPSCTAEQSALLKFWHGVAEHAQGQCISAARWFEAAANSFIDVHNRAKGWVNQGIALSEGGELNRAYNIFEELADWSQENDVPEARFRACLELHRIARKVNDGQSAKRWLEGAAAIAPSIGGTFAAAQVALEFGAMSAELNELERAADYYKQAEANFAAVENDELSSSTEYDDPFNSEIAARDREYERTRFRAALTSYSEGLSRRIGKSGEAASVPTLSVSGRPFMISEQIGYKCNEIGQAVLSGRIEKAKRLAIETLKYADDAAYLNGRFRVRELLTTIYSLRGQYEPALRMAIDSLDLLELMRSRAGTETGRIGFLADKNAIYQVAITLCLRLAEVTSLPKYLQQALGLIERARSRALIELLGSSTQFQPPEGVPADVIAQESTLLELLRRAQTLLFEKKNDRYFASREIEELHSDLIDIWGKMESTSPEYVDLRRGNPPSYKRLSDLPKRQAARLSSADLGRSDLKDAGVALLEYYFGEDELHIFGLSSRFEGVEVVTLPIDQAELRRFISANFGEHGRVRDIFSMGLDELWHSWDPLVAPVARWAKAGDVVYLVPHGLTHYLPFHALKVDGEFLIERNPVVFTPSAATLEYCCARKDQHIENQRWTPSAAVFGNSRGDLPSSRNEAVAVADFFGARPILEKDVTRRTMESLFSKSEFFHVAGHGFFDSKDPLNSGILLADAVLSARELFSMKCRRAKLVTLSGCETAINEARPGDELVGLTRALLYAGTPSVLASLWRVNDNSTNFLITQFYWALKEGFSKVGALRHAMTVTKAQDGWASPYHWAPFVLTGDFL